MNPVHTWAAVALTVGLTVTAAGQPPATPPVTPAGQPAVPTPTGWPREIGGRDVKGWVADLSDPDPGVQQDAARTLPQFGPDARRLAVKPLIEMIGNPDPGVRVNAMLAVGALGVEDDRDIQRLVVRLIGCIDGTAPGSAIRLQAARALGAIGTDAHQSTAILVRLGTTDLAWETRAAAAHALGRVGAPLYEDKPGPTGAPVVKRPANKLALDKLAFNLIKDPSVAVRMEAVQSLMLLGPPDIKDLDLYIKTVQPYADAVSARLRPYKAGDKEAGEKDPAVVIWLKMLGIMYDDRQMVKFIGQIGQATADRNPAVRLHALKALAVLGPEAKPALEAIRATAKDADPMIATNGIATLAAMREAGRPALPDLEAIRQTSKYDEVKAAAATAIDVLRPGKMEVPKKK